MKRTVSVNQLAEIFGMNPRTVRKNLLRGPESEKLPGRPCIFTEEEERRIIQKLKDQYEANLAFSRKQLLSFVLSEFDKSASRGWIDGFLARHQREIKICQSLPQEETRFIIPQEFLNQHLINMQKLVAGRVAELVFNLDEVGSSDWEDRKTRKLIIPSSVDSHTIFHPVTRRFKHMTLLVCISAGGDALCPLLITAQALPQDVCDDALRLGEDVKIVRREPPYIDEGLFQDYLSTVFVPYVVAVREKLELDHERAVLLMDGMKAHCTEPILHHLGQNNIAVITFPPHTTNLFQPLDLSFFGALKRRKQGTQSEVDGSRLTGQIQKLFQAYEETGSSSNVRGSFRRAGFRHNTKMTPYTLEFDEAVARRVPGFQEIWDKNYSIEMLQRRRALPQFGLMNSQYLH
jgi:hypothetical protein